MRFDRKNRKKSSKKFAENEKVATFASAITKNDVLSDCGHDSEKQEKVKKKFL